MPYLDEIQRAIESRDFEAALELVAQNEAEHGGEPDFISVKAYMCASAGELEAARNILLAGLKKLPENASLLYNLGSVLEDMDNTLGAYNAYRMALQTTDDPKLKLDIKSRCAELADVLGDNRKVSIIVLTYNKYEYNRLCIESIKRYTKPGTYELIVVDNASTDETPGWLQEQRGIRVILNKYNVGFPKGCNIGIREADPNNDILLLNNDIVVAPRWLENLKTALYASPLTGAVCPCTNAASNNQAVLTSIKNVKDVHEFAMERNKSNSALWEERQRLIAYCLLIKNEAFRKLGLLDERFSPGNYEDDDYCMRLRGAGYRLKLCFDTFIYHFGSLSFKANSGYVELLAKNRRKFIEKWGVAPEAYIQNYITVKHIFDCSPPPKRVLVVNCYGGGDILQILQSHPDTYVMGISRTPNALVGDAKERLNIVVGEPLAVLAQMDETFGGALINTEGIGLNPLPEIIGALTGKGCSRIVLFSIEPLDIGGALPQGCRIREDSDTNGCYMIIDL